MSDAIRLKLLDAGFESMRWLVSTRSGRHSRSCAMNNQLRTGADKGNPTV